VWAAKSTVADAAESSDSKGGHNEIRKTYSCCGNRNIRRADDPLAYCPGASEKDHHVPLLQLIDIGMFGGPESFLNATFNSVPALNIMSAAYPQRGAVSGHVRRSYKFITLRRRPECR
jgi:hypothetical protein